MQIAVVSRFCAVWILFFSTSFKPVRDETWHSHKFSFLNQSNDSWHVLPELVVQCSVPGQVIPKTWKTVLAACPASCSALMGGGAKEHFTRVAAVAAKVRKQPRGPRRKYKRRWAPRTTINALKQSFSKQWFSTWGCKSRRVVNHFWGSWVDISCTQLYYVCFIRIFDGGCWVIVGCCNWSRYDKVDNRCCKSWYFTWGSWMWFKWLICSDSSKRVIDFALSRLLLLDLILNNFATFPLQEPATFITMYQGSMTHAFSVWETLL